MKKNARIYTDRGNYLFQDIKKAPNQRRTLKR